MAMFSELVGGGVASRLAVFASDMSQLYIQFLLTAFLPIPVYKEACDGAPLLKGRLAHRLMGDLALISRKESTA